MAPVDEFPSALVSSSTHLGKRNFFGGPLDFNCFDWLSPEEEILYIPFHKDRGGTDKASGGGIRGDYRGAMKETEDYLASELNKLSLQERSKAAEDVHCVGANLEEEPGMLQRALEQFALEVQKEQNPIYELAAGQDPTFVQDRDFRTKFLRADFYDAKKAVRRMMSFLKYKMTYFGQDRLTKDITLDDLDEEDIDLLRSGLFHIQNEKDRSGRFIVYLFNHMLGNCTAKALIRVAYYIWWNILIPKPEVQLKGLCGVYYDMKHQCQEVKHPKFNFMLTIMDFTQSLPMRYSSMHCCIKTGKGNMALNNAILGIALTVFPQYARVRCRLHYGSDLEVQYELQSHGIPIRSCPMDAFGALKRDTLNVWLDKYREIEELQQQCEPSPLPFAYSPSNNNSSGNGALYKPDISSNSNQMNLFSSSQTPITKDSSILYRFEDSKKRTNSNMNIDPIPTSFSNSSSPPDSLPKMAAEPTMSDVLFGRGKNIQNHPGNIQFRAWLDGHRAEYDRTPRNKRRRIATELTNIMSASGIRFLKISKDDQWVECDAVEAEDKIAQLFRSIRKHEPK